MKNYGSMVKKDNYKLYVNGKLADKVLDNGKKGDIRLVV